MEPFGTHQPEPKIQQKIDWCQRLPANWLGKQVAQLLRRQVMSKASMPLDITLGQVKLRCYLTDNVSERGFVFMPWRWDYLERQVLLKLLPADGVFIDIGANVGLYAAMVATHLNRLGVIVAIEPNPDVYQRLRFNLEATIADLAEQPRAELLQQGISDETGEFSLYLNEDNLGASSLLPGESPGDAINVPCTPLLDVIESQKLSRVDVIKCDIEGAEDRALMPFLVDAPNHLLPACFIFENNASQWQGDLLETLQHRGYLPTHETRLNLIYQLRQPTRQAESNKKFKGVAPAIS